jgi:hypothetical protein
MVAEARSCRDGASLSTRVMMFQGFARYLKYIMEFLCGTYSFFLEKMLRTYDIIVI